MKKYVVMCRCEDDIYTDILTEEELEKRLNGAWNDYKFLTEIPFDACNFPRNALFVMKGEVITSKELFQLLK